MKKILVAKITSAHGIKGEVNIISFCQNEKDLQNFDLFDEKNNQIKLKTKSKNQKDASGNHMLIAKIEGVDDRNAAQKLNGTEIFTDRKNFKKPKNNEYYQIDLIGLDVVDENGKKIGKTTNIFDFGAGSMLEIEFLDKNKELENFPFKNEFFGKVDVEKGFIEFFAPEVIKE